MIFNDKAQVKTESANRDIQGPLMKDSEDSALIRQISQIARGDNLYKLLLESGNNYLRSSNVENAILFYSKILSDLSGIDGTEIDELFIETAIQYSKASTAPRHNSQNSCVFLEEALERALKQRKEDHQAILFLHLAKYEWLSSNYKKALEYFDQGWALANKLGSQSVIRAAQTWAVFFSFWKGRFQETIDLYEKYAPDTQIFPEGKFPLLVTLLVGHCYAMTGQVTQGIGMVDAILSQCLKKRDMYSATYAKLTMGSIMIDIGKIDEALSLIEPWLEESRTELNAWAWLWGKLAIATCFYLKEDYQKARSHLLEFQKTSVQKDINTRFYNYLLKLCLGMRQGKLEPVPGLSLEKEVETGIAGKNTFLMGVAHRYKAIMQREELIPAEKIVQSLQTSIELLKKSGHQMELAMSEFELIRQYMLQGEKDKAKKLAVYVSKHLAPPYEPLIPDDIKALVKDISADKDLFSEILKISQKIIAIRDNREMMQFIISSVNMITGAERGAMFLLQSSEDSINLELKASINITSEQVESAAFDRSKEMMLDAVRKRKGLFLGKKTESQETSDSLIRSQICVPMILRDDVVGVLYNDNQLFENTFKEKDLDILTYFATQAAIALDNVTSYEEIQRLNEKLQQENKYYIEDQIQSHHFDDIIGESPAIHKVLSKIEQVAPTDSTVLITGETGVGKEMVARAIHQNSPRKDKPFIRVFCNALPESLIPSELFGHEKGAFTGATNRRIGKFELADGGTLFLDEIGELPRDIQTQLLIVLQNREFERIGGESLIQSDFRLILATNRNLEKEVEEKRFRSDLYYRINVFPLHIPPLRQRSVDIPLLAHHFLGLYASKMSKPVSAITERNMNSMMQHEWPGNVRELENIIERGVILSSGPEFQLPELKTPDQDKNIPAFDSGGETLEENEYRHILTCLQKTGWKIRGPGGASEILGIHPSTLDFRIKKLGIKKPGKRKKK